MTTLPQRDRGSQTARLFPYERWGALLPSLSARYRDATPFPHMRFEAFLDDEVAREVLAEFPAPTDTVWIQYKHFNENKLGKNDRADFPPTIGRVIDELNSPEFVAWLSKLTGIEGLQPDPMLEGGGMHLTERGGFLNVHADFRTHHYRKNWIRRCNLILYLNEGWQEHWGGALELWDRDMRACTARIAPLFNHAVIFNTGRHSLHGYPDPIQCDLGVTRKSLALYYFVDGEPPREGRKSTTYRPRPQDGALHAMLIRLDNRCISLYSWLKTKLRISDGWASRFLGFFFDRRK